VNPEFSVEALTIQEESMLRLREARLRLWKEYQTAYALETAVTQQFHSGILGARRSVRAQYDGDAPAIQAVGLTRSSDRKRS
jgi:hypothetical protein